MRERRLPADWPVDRTLDNIESKLGPFDGYGDYQKQTGEERSERLGDDGLQLMMSLSEISTLMMDYDMTIEEAIECTEYVVEKCRNS